MPRPLKCRKVCCLPKTTMFVPANNTDTARGCVVLSVDEYEAVRLIDNEGLDQEKCGQHMKIARTTVQQIYNNARKKLALALVNGLVIKIEGGSYRLCGGKEAECGCMGCCRHNPINKENPKMIIALPADENKTDICPSFARCPYFMLHDVEANASKLLNNPAASAQGGAGIKSAQFLLDNGVTAVITPRCGQNAANVLKPANVAIYKAEGLSLNDNIKMLAEKKLSLLQSFHAGFHGKQ